MSFTAKVLVWMLGGVLAGVAIQRLTDAPAHSGLTLAADPAGVRVAAVSGPAAKAKLVPGEVFTAVVRERGTEAEARTPLERPEDFDAVVAAAENGDTVWLERPAGEPRLLTLGLDPQSDRALWLAPFSFVADLFMALLKMLIVPIVFASIVTGVAGLGGGRELGRLGSKAFLYYTSTSLLAIFVGQVLVSVVQPGHGAHLGLSPLGEAAVGPDVSFVEILKGMVPQNVFAALTDNGAMLQLIFFALLFGLFTARAPEPHRTRVREFFESLLAVIMQLAQAVLKLIPYGVFALLARVVADTGLAVFRPLLLYMGVVALALAIHATITLPLVLRLVGGIHPWRWAQAMAPALITAFSTSSSSLTLPVTMETVEDRGRVSNRLASFTLPLGATVNMDGTALYECVGVIFLAQFYAATNPAFTLTMGDQVLVVLMALLASIGAAGIPSAGLVMMLTILSALHLPLEGAALLLAVDRPLDMLRTAVNVWSDTCGAAVIARTEGEAGPLAAGPS